MEMVEIESWRDFDEAVAEANRLGTRALRAHSSLVFRGLASASYSNRHSAPGRGSLDISEGGGAMAAAPPTDTSQGERD